MKKGGHGGDRSGSGLPPGYWEEQGGRAAAAEAKAAEKAKDEVRKRKAAEQWQQWAAPIHAASAEK